MIPLYIFLGVAALYFACAYELVASMTKYPKTGERARWPEKGDK